MEGIMTNRKRKINTLKLSFLISFIYVFSATLVCYLDGYNHYIPPELALILYLVFFPAIVFPNVILYAEGDGPSSYPYVLVCQIITLLVIWLLSYTIVKAIRTKSSRTNVVS